MRQLLPTAVETVDPTRVYEQLRPAPPGRPWLLVGMVASLDGATVVDGRSGGLGGAGDRAVLRALRGLADVVLVGAGTVRTEGYGPVRLDDEVQEARVLRGQAPVPRLAIVSRSLRLDLDRPLFTESDPPPLVVTTDAADTARRVELTQRADLLLAGHGADVDPVATLAALGELGAEVVVCEGGPSLNGQLLEAGLVDEVCLTVAPWLVGGSSSRIVAGAEGTEPVRFTTTHVLEDAGDLFVRAVATDRLRESAQDG